MSYEVIGKVTHIARVEKVGPNKTNKRIFVITTCKGQYNFDLAFQLWKDKCALMDAIRCGDIVQVAFDISSREYEGKYYTDLKAYRVKAQQERDEYNQDTHPENEYDQSGDDNTPF